MRRATKAKKQYMSDAEFAELKQSLSEVVSYLKGGTHRLKVTHRVVKAKAEKIGCRSEPRGTQAPVAMDSRTLPVQFS